MAGCSILVAGGLHLAVKVDIEFRRGELTSSEQSVVSEGFRAQTEEHDAPEYRKERVKWLAFDEQNDIGAVLTAVIQWDWIYIDELWVARETRGQGLGRGRRRRWG